MSSFCLLLALVMPAHAEPAAITAQTVMIDPDISGDFIIDNSQIWQYDPSAAATFFDNHYVSTDGPVCNGAGCSSPYTCTVTAPTAPAVNSLELDAVVSSNTCNFWTGGTLGGSTYAVQKNVQATCTYTSPATTSCVKTVCTGPVTKGKASCTNNVSTCTPNPGPAQAGYYYVATSVPGTTDTKNPQYKYTFNYAVTPTLSTVDGKTAWDMISDSTAPALVTIGGTIAAQQVVRKTGGTSPWTMKSTHGLLNADGTAKITSLYARIDWIDGTADVDADGNLDDVPASTGDIDLTYTLDSSLDFSYRPNAGLNGDASLPFSGLISEITDGAAFNDAGLHDDFAGNDGEGATCAVLDSMDFTLYVPSTYTLSIWGTITSIDAFYQEPFSVTKTIHYSAGTCTN